jgi:5-methylcytosine-specific restriction endonuclease McrA
LDCYRVGWASEAWHQVKDAYGKTVLICAGCRGTVQRRRGFEHYSRRRPAIPKAVRDAVLLRDGLVCHWCGRGVRGRQPGEAYDPAHVHLDHKIPFVQTRSHEPANLVVSCADCNLRKGARR